MSFSYIDSLSYRFVKSPKKQENNNYSDMPSVEVSFTATTPYVNGKTVKLKAEYIEFTDGNFYKPVPYGNSTFTESYLMTNFQMFQYTGITGTTIDRNVGLSKFLCYGYETIYVKVKKTKQINGNYNISFEFYALDPQEYTTTKPFAKTSIQAQENPSELKNEDNVLSNTINSSNSSRDNLGTFEFLYYKNQDDELYSLADGETRYFNYQLQTDSIVWNSATLLYKDEVSEGNIVEDLINSYPVIQDIKDANKGTITLSKNYWDFPTDLGINTMGKYVLRVKLVDNNGSDASVWQSSVILCSNTRYSSNEIAYFKPVFKYDRSEKYEFNPDYCISETPHFHLTVPKNNSLNGSEDDFNGIGENNLMKSVIYYRYSEVLYQINDVEWNMLTTLKGEIQYDFYMTWLGDSGSGGAISDGEKTIYLQLSDGVGNTSLIVSYAENDTEDDLYKWTKDSIRKIYLYRQSPNSIVFNLYGSSGSEYYTGMCRIDKNGKVDKENKIKDFKFIPTNKIEVLVSAQDNLNLPLEYQLFMGNDFNENNWKEFNPETNKKIPFYLESESNDSIFENNYAVTINLVFRNSAGISSEIQSKTMYYNTQLLKTDNINLREQNTSYKPEIQYFNGDEWVGIPEQESFNSIVPKRSWQEIFYPKTHGFPLNANGNINIEEALKVVDGDSMYDAVKTEIKIVQDYDENGRPIKDNSGNPVVHEEKHIVYDDEQRPLTIWNETKKYPSNASSSKEYNSETGEISSFVYWIIDNSGYADFQLEFEHFHLDSSRHTNENHMSGYPGDCLVIYDASEEGTTKEFVNIYGKNDYKLIDSTKLKKLAVYTGDGVDATCLYPTDNVGSVNANANGGFITPKFNAEKICVIFYSDDSQNNKSGFKIKASPMRDTDWINWEIDNKRGEVWLHRLETQQLEGSNIQTPSINAGRCPANVRMNYEYSDTNFDINYEDGSIKFYEKPQGQLWGTFSYYNYSEENGPYILNEENGKYEPITYTFALGDDDLVDYKDVSVYSTYTDGEGSNKELKYDKKQSNTYVFETIDKETGNIISEESHGKIITNVTVYKDSGLIVFNKKEMEKDTSKTISLPKGRLIADYNCHSFYRLTDDGYGNLYFYDKIIVPDKSENYPDFTYVDLKVVNEGEATLKNGRIKFNFRGIASGTSANTISSVLNPDRPWDVQEGTPEETFDQVGGVVSVNYNFPTMTWSNALSIYEGAVDVGDIKLQGGKTEIPFKVDMEMKKEIYIRVVWVMFTGGNENSPTYITPSTAGEKCFSGEIEGSFYTVEI